MKYIIKNIVENLKLKTKNNKIPQIHKVSYSQCGEDLIVDYIFKLRGITKPSYIDIGANSPYLLNNTAIFYQRGSRGINIDANPDCIRKFQLERPDDINLSLGIGAESGLKTLFIMNDSTLSTFSETECKKYLGTGYYELIEEKIVEISTIHNILSDYSNNIFPDFLSLDVEGLDFDILKTIDFMMASPKVICVEAAEYSPRGTGKRRNEIIEFLNCNGFFEYANTNLNSIMVNRDFWFV